VGIWELRGGWQVGIWELRGGRQVQTLAHHNHQCRSVEYTPDGRWLVTASFDGTVAVVDVRDGQVAAVLAGHADKVVQAEWVPLLRSILAAALFRAKAYA
ncbi:hypothetical protein T484DRAFT_1762356, partial [Baffinella frigidus]